MKSSSADFTINHQHHLKINAKMKEKMYEYNISHQHTIGISHNITYDTFLSWLSC